MTVYLGCLTTFRPEIAYEKARRPLLEYVQAEYDQRMMLIERLISAV